MPHRFCGIVLCLVCCLGPAASQPELIPNGGFEQLADGWPVGWARMWMREEGAGEAKVTGDAHSGQRAILMSYTGARDWSLHLESEVSVEPGDILVMRAWTKAAGEGAASLSVVTMDAQGKTMEWIWGAGEIAKGDQWQQTTARMVMPDGCAKVRPRVTGWGRLTLTVDDISLVKEGNVRAMQEQANLPERLTIANALVEVNFLPREGSLGLRDLRSGREWAIEGAADGPIVTSARKVGRALRAELLDAASALRVNMEASLEAERAELSLALRADGNLPRPLRFPGAAQTKAGDWLVIPMNEGILYPVDDESIRPMRLIGYGGHGISMSWYGVTDMGRGLMAIVETPDDASIRIGRGGDGMLTVRPEWESSKGQFAYERKLRFVLFDMGSYVAQAKRYREYAKQVGKFKRLREKAEFNPNVEKLYGAVNVWPMGGGLDLVNLGQEFRQLGMERALFNVSGWLPAERKTVVIDELNRLGFLTGRYDIYQDLQPPEVAEEHNLRHPDWTQDAWPDDIMTGPNGDWVKGWVVKRGDQSFPCAVLCDRQAVPYARKRITEDLATNNYKARFIDTTTASPWRECYHPDHPMTRSDSRKFKMELLRYVSEEAKLVTGTETGIDPSVPFVHYYEGMLSLGPYRVPDAGRRMLEPAEPIERIVKFQVGHYYRVPLWELVYHDCTVSMWYWGDYNNKVPAVWDRRDLFNLLYGTPPMFMFNQDIWTANRDRFVQSYNAICPTVAEVADQEMVNHEFLTPDHTVQRTTFVNGTQIVVNFGENGYDKAGVSVGPMGSTVLKPR
ncbi:MAG: glycoside hydrolase [Armatimonadota bacterium]